MAETCHADELLEIFGNELRSVITDDSRVNTWVFFQGSLNNDFNILFNHR